MNEVKKVTNFQKIKAMSIDEMAEFIFCLDYCSDFDDCSKCFIWHNFRSLCKGFEEKQDNKTCEYCKNIDMSKCYHKQLKRLEQENEELKEENKQHIKEKQILNERLYCYAYEKDCHLVCKQQNCLLKDSYKYRSALKEIREKIKSLKEDICNNCGWHNTDNCQPNGYVCHDLIKIQNKISEVLNAK